MNWKFYRPLRTLISSLYERFFPCISAPNNNKQQKFCSSRMHANRNDDEGAIMGVLKYILKSIIA